MVRQRTQQIDVRSVLAETLIADHEIDRLERLLARLVARVYAADHSDQFPLHRLSNTPGGRQG